LPQNSDRLAGDRRALPAERIPVLNDGRHPHRDQRPDPGLGRRRARHGHRGGIDNFFIACGFTAGIAASGGGGSRWQLDRAWRSRDGSCGRSILRRFGSLHSGLAYLRDAAIESTRAIT
jgi:4-methylaminobutanoate oxidase (formaldehyde-forming)